MMMTVKKITLYSVWWWFCWWLIGTRVAVMMKMSTTRGPCGEDDGDDDSLSNNRHSYISTSATKLAHPHAQNMDAGCPVGHGITTHWIVTPKREKKGQAASLTLPASKLLPPGINFADPSTPPLRISPNLNAPPRAWLVHEEKWHPRENIRHTLGTVAFLRRRHWQIKTLGETDLARLSSIRLQNKGFRGTSTSIRVLLVQITKIHSKRLETGNFREPEATYKDSLSARDDYTLSTCKPVSEEENLDRENFYVASLGVIQDSVNRYHSKVWPDTLVNQDCICRRFAAK